MRDEGIEGTGEVGDADPLNAATDAIAEHGIDEIIVSTLPATSLGLAAARPDRARRERDRAAGRARRGRPRRARACRSTSRSWSPTRRRRAASSSSASRSSPRRARAASSSSSRRTAATGRAVQAPRASGSGSCSSRCAATGIVAAGMIGDPDPYTATHERAPVLPHRRDRDLDAARDRRSGSPTRLIERVRARRGKPRRARRVAAPSRWTA